MARRLDEALDDAYRIGYSAGRGDASASCARVHFTLTDELLREAIALTHPDRHPPDRCPICQVKTLLSPSSTPRSYTCV